MLTQAHCTFTTENAARAALTGVRKYHRVALRGALVLRDPGLFSYCVHYGMEGTGFSPAELGAELRAAAFRAGLETHVK
jgi:hypothetical protein